MRIRKSLAAFVLAGALVTTFGSGISVSAENQGTDGTEIQVMEAEQEGEMESQSGENASGEMGTEVQQTASADASTGPAVKGESNKKMVAGIPIKHLVLFSVGMVASVGGLIAIHIVQKRREEQDEYDEEDYDEEEE